MVGTTLNKNATMRLKGQASWTGGAHGSAKEHSCGAAEVDLSWSLSEEGPESMEFRCAPMDNESMEAVRAAAVEAGLSAAPAALASLNIQLHLIS